MRGKIWKTLKISLIFFKTSSLWCRTFIQFRYLPLLVCLSSHSPCFKYNIWNPKGNDNRQSETMKLIQLSSIHSRVSFLSVDARPFCTLSVSAHQKISATNPNSLSGILSNTLIITCSAAAFSWFGELLFLVVTSFIYASEILLHGLLVFDCKIYKLC